MTDELLYERLAISVAHLGSPLPHVHGVLIPNASQLYPLLIAPAIVLQETAFSDGATRPARLRAGFRRAVSSHRLLAVFYVLLTVTAIVLSAAGKLSSTVGTYAHAVEGNPFPAHFVPSLA